MTVRPHDTDRILATLGDAIEKLRIADAPYYKGGERYSVADEVANDLAFLHGAVSAERDRFEADVEEFVTASLTASLEEWADDPDVEEDVAIFRRKMRALFGPAPVPENARGKPLEFDHPRLARRRLLRSIHEEELQAEVDRGEHREDDDA